MLPLRFARYWRFASVAILLLVLAATLMPALWFFSDRREFAVWFFDVDKWLHGFTFFILAIWFSGQYKPQSYWQVAFGLFMFGWLIEGCQRLVSYRTAELYDVAADTAGIVLGLSVALVGLGGWSLRVEERFATPVTDAEP